MTSPHERAEAGEITRKEARRRSGDAQKISVAAGCLEHYRDADPDLARQLHELADAIYYGRLS